MKKALKKKFHVFFISPFLDGIYGEDLSYTDILIAIFSEFLSNIPENVKLPKSTMNELVKLLNDLDAGGKISVSNATEESVKVGFLSLISLKINQSDDVRREFNIKAEKNIRKILSLFDDLLANMIKKNNGIDRIVIIVDDLEKVIRDEVIIDFLHNHGNLLLGRDCDFIITINNNMKFYRQGYQTILKLEEFFCLPFIAIKNRNGTYNQKEIDKIKEIICKRVHPELINEKGLELAIIYSGGSLSSLFRIYGTAMSKINSSECKVLPEYVMEAFYDGRYRNGYLEHDYLLKLRSAHRKNQDFREVLKTEEIKNDLYNCILLTYRDRKNRNMEWYELNPEYYYEEDLAQIEKKYIHK